MWHHTAGCPEMWRKAVRLLPWGLTNWRVTMNRDLDPAVVLLACIVGMAITAGLCALLHWTGIW